MREMLKETEELEVSSEVLEMRAWLKPNKSVLEGRFLQLMDK